MVVLAGLGFACSGLVGYVAVRRRRRMGAVSWPVPPPGLPVSTDSATSLLHVIGGANVPTGYLRVNGTWPFGVLDYAEGHVMIMVRGGKLFAAKPLYAATQDLAAVFPVRTGIGGRGVGFRMHDGREWYFWTGQGHRILTVLGRDRFPVSPDEQKARKVWRLEP